VTPDGTGVVTSATGTFGSGLAWIPIASGTAHVLTTNTLMDQPMMLADGRTIWGEGYYSPTGSYGFRLRAASPDGSTVTTIDPDIANVSPEYLKISPDGKSVLYLTCPSSCYPSGFTLMFALVAGGSPITLATGVASSEFGISNDGKTAFYMDAFSFSSGGTLHTIPALGGTPTTIATGAVRGLEMYAKGSTFTPDGSRLIFFTSLSGFSATMQSAVVSGGTVATLVADVHGEYAFTGDGTRVVTRTYSAGDVHSIAFDGSSDTVLASAIQAFALSPDGSKILLASDPKGFCTAISCSTTNTTNVLDLASGTSTALMADVTFMTWLGDANVLDVRAGIPSPSSFQNGLYLTATP
jgi:Tol biopolymer transport system component